MGSLVGVIFCARVALCASESVNALQGVEYGVTDWMRMMQLKVIKMTMKMMLMLKMMVIMATDAYIR